MGDDLSFALVGQGDRARAFRSPAVFVPGPSWLLGLTTVASSQRRIELDVKGGGPASRSATAASNSANQRDDNRSRATPTWVSAAADMEYLPEDGKIKVRFVGGLRGRETECPQRLRSAW